MQHDFVHGELAGVEHGLDAHHLGEIRSGGGGPRRAFVGRHLARADRGKTQPRAERYRDCEQRDGERSRRGAPGRDGRAGRAGAAGADALV